MKSIKAWAAHDRAAYWVVPGATKTRMQQNGFNLPTWRLVRVEIRELPPKARKGTG